MRNVEILRERERERATLLVDSISEANVVCYAIKKKLYIV